MIFWGSYNPIITQRLQIDYTCEFGSQKTIPSLVLGALNSIRVVYLELLGNSERLPLPSKDSYFQAFGPKDPIMRGFWAILMLKDRPLNPKP